MSNSNNNGKSFTLSEFLDKHNIEEFYVECGDKYLHLDNGGKTVRTNLEIPFKEIRKGTANIEFNDKGDFLALSDENYKMLYEFRNCPMMIKHKQQTDNYEG